MVVKIKYFAVCFDGEMNCLIDEGGAIDGFIYQILRCLPASCARIYSTVMILPNEFQITTM